MVNESENKETKAVAGLLGTLPRVEAPNDFNFRVKARIAAGRPVRVSWLPTAARVAVPLGLVLSVGGYFGYRSIFQPAANDAVIVSNFNSASAPQPQTTPEIVSANITTETTGDSNSARLTVKPPTVDDKTLSSIGPVTDPRVDLIGGDRRTTAKPRGGSIDESVKESKTIFPRGLNPHNRVLVKPRDFDGPGSITAKDLLTQFGADVVYSGNGWRIAAVKENSTAQKAGLKNGDVVEAINDQTLGEKTSFKGQFSGKSIRLKRDGATVTIDLTKNP